MITNRNFTQATPTTLSQNLTTAQTAEVLGIKKETLGQMRWRGTGPVFLKIGRCVRYRVSDLEDYMKGRTFSSTTEAGGRIA